jgi:hypothetical protein
MTARGAAVRAYRLSTVAEATGVAQRLDETDRTEWVRKSMATLRYIDIGVTSAAQFWREVVLPDYDQFAGSPTARDAVHAAVTAWHLHDWVWREQPNYANNRDLLRRFQNKLIANCPQIRLLWVSTEKAKHRDLYRPVEVGNVGVRKVEPDSKVERDFGLFVIRGTSPVTIILDDGTSYQFADVLSGVIHFWRTHWFPSS